MSRRHLLLGTVVGAPLCALLALVLVVALFLTTGRLPFATGATWFTVTKVGEAHFSDEPTEPFFFLAVGNDGRTGDKVTRGDALHLIGVNPAAHSATILDIPRDTGAAIPGHGTDKINAAMAYGGLRSRPRPSGTSSGSRSPTRSPPTSTASWLSSTASRASTSP